MAQMGRIAWPARTAQPARSVRVGMSAWLAVGVWLARSTQVAWDSGGIPESRRWPCSCWVARITQLPRVPRMSRTPCSTSFSQKPPLSVEHLPPFPEIGAFGGESVHTTAVQFAVLFNCLC